DPRAVARELRVDGYVVGGIAELLRRQGLLAAVEGPRETFVLARDARDIDLAALGDVVVQDTAPAGCDPRVRRALARAQGEGRLAWRESLADLVDQTTDISPQTAEGPQL